MRLVLDTSVIVASFRSVRGASRALLKAFDADQYNLLISQPLFAEYEEVLTRPEQMRVHGASRFQIDEFLDNLSARSIHISFHWRIRPQLRDPDDDMVLETAVNGIADGIVTHNVADFLQESNRFGIPIWTPGNIIKARLRK